MFAKNSLAYSGVNFLSQLVVFLQSLLLRRFLQPSLMGVWNFVGVVRSFSAPLTLGIQAGSLRKLPILRGSQRNHLVSEVQSVTLTYSLVEVAIVALGVVLYGLWRGPSPKEFGLIVFGSAALLLLAARLQECYITFFQAEQLYIPLSRVLFWNAFFMGILTIGGTFFGGLWGLFLGALLGELVKGFWLSVSAGKWRIRPKFAWDWSIFKDLGSYSFFYRIVDYPITLFFMLDLLWVTHFMGLEALAIYATARSFFIQSSDITIRFGTVLLTRTFEQYGRGVDREKIAKDIFRFIEFQLLLSVPLVCWGVFLVIPLLLRQVAPLYVAAIYPLSLLLLANLFDLRNNNLHSIWLAEKRLGDFGKVNLLSLLFLAFFLFSTRFLLHYKSLTAVGGAVLAGYLSNFLLTMGTIGLEILGSKRVLLLLLEGILGALWIGLLFWVRMKGEPLALSFAQDLLFTAKKGALMLLWLVPLFLVGFARTKPLELWKKRVAAS